MANFLRVLTLVLIAYYGGIDLVDGVLHDLTGIALFVFAITLLFLFDGLLGLVGVVWRWVWSRRENLRMKQVSHT